MASRMGVDVGGTFTDLIILDEKTGKVVVGKLPSTPSSPEIGVLAVVDDSASEHLDSSDYFVHGTTVGLNALLERKGALVGLVTTRGFRDILEMRRSVRAVAYDQMWRAPEPLVPRNLRLEVTERMLADGAVDVPLVAEDVIAAAAQFAAAASMRGRRAPELPREPRERTQVERLLARRLRRHRALHRSAVSTGVRATSTTVVDSYGTGRERLSRSPDVGSPIGDSTATDLISRSAVERATSPMLRDDRSRHHVRAGRRRSRNRRAVRDARHLERDRG